MTKLVTFCSVLSGCVRPLWRATGLRIADPADERWFPSLLIAAITETDNRSRKSCLAEERRCDYNLLDS